MILWRAGYRHLLRHPWQTVLSIIGVALGVAVVTAVDLANASAHRAFRIAAETIAGRATHQIVGGPTGLPEEFYTLLRTRQQLRSIAPVVAGFVEAAGSSGTTLRLIGIDPFAEAPFRTFSSDLPHSSELRLLLTRPDTGMLSRETAQRLGLTEGRGLALTVPGTGRLVTVAGILDAPDDVTRQGLDGVLVTDIATAQELLGREGRLTRIDLIVPEGTAGEQLLSSLRKILPPGATIIPAGAQATALDRMTRAFRLNLTALSLLALVVGMFLIYNTTTFSVIRRRRLIGMLRALGVTRRQVFALVLGETLMIGVVGTGAGILMGMLLGGELTRLVTRTINDLYFVTTVRSVRILPFTLIKSLLLGIGATLAAAIPPALEATGAPPRAVLSRSVMEIRRRKAVPLAALAGLLTLLAGGGILMTGWGGITTGFLGLFGIIIGYALMVPAAMVFLSHLFRPFLSLILGVLGRMAARGVVVSLSRTGVATAALVVAVAAAIGVGIMVDSFRLTVAQWLESWLRADIYVTTTGTGTGRDKPSLDPLMAERLARIPGTAAVSRTRRVTIESAEGTTDLLAMDIPQATFMGYRFKEGNARQAWNSFSRGEAVLVSEPYAWRHRLHAGDRVTLRSDRGERSFPVAAVFYDYGTDAGIVALARSVYVMLWNDPGIDGMGFYIAPGAVPGELARQIRTAVAGAKLTVISNRELREASMRVFDRTFAITGVLRLLTLVVAFVGILSALMALQVERTRELATLRAIGLTPGQVWGVVCGETGLIGIIAGLLSLPLGIMQAFVLIHVINRRSFGWSMELALDPAVLAQAVALALTAALLAGVYPSLLITRTSPAAALREEE